MVELGYVLTFWWSNIHSNSGYYDVTVTSLSFFEQNIHQQYPSSISFIDYYHEDHNDLSTKGGMGGYTSDFLKVPPLLPHESFWNFLGDMHINSYQSTLPNFFPFDDRKCHYWRLKEEVQPPPTRMDHYEVRIYPQLPNHIHTSPHTHTETYTHAHTHTHIKTNIHKQTHTNTHQHIHRHRHRHTHTHTLTDDNSGHERSNSTQYDQRSGWK